MQEISVRGEGSIRQRTRHHTRDVYHKDYNINGAEMFIIQIISKSKLRESKIPKNSKFYKNKSKTKS